MDNIIEVIKNHPNATISMTLGDLLQFHNRIAEDARKEFMERLELENNDRLLTVNEAVTFLRKKGVIVSQPTLWTWKEKKYLIPIEFGGFSYYKLSVLNDMLNNRKKKCNEQ